MGQLFNRISRVVRAEMNSDTGDYSEGIYPNEGTALVAGGAVMGASIGKVGILAGGTGYSLGAVPLAAVGALTGAALYEALRSLIEGDASSTNVAVIGAATGAVTSAAIGGVGVAVGGSAIGVGMASMAAGGAVVGLGLVGLNRLLQQGIDPEQLLDSAIEQMERDLEKARQASINVIASQQRLQQQYEKIEAEVDLWGRRVQLALQKGDDYLAGEALSRKNMHSRTLNSFKAHLGQQPTSVQNLKQNLARLAVKIAEAKMMRISLKSQMATARVNGQLHSIVNRVDTGSAISAFNRIEDKILQMEAFSQAKEELTGDNLESYFSILATTDVDEELVAMKAEVIGLTRPVQSQSLDSDDIELENLKRMMDDL